MKSWYNFAVIVTIMMLSIPGCKIFQRTQVPSIVDQVPHNNNTLTCTIEAINLSEDMSIVSSKNDEIFFFIYSNLDSTYHQESTFSYNGVFDHQHLKQSFQIDTNRITNATVVIIEEDSGRPASTIDSIVSKNIQSLTAYYLETDYTKTRQILGDDDILYIQHFDTIDSSTTFTLKQIHKMDKYEYNIKFE